MWGVLFVSVVLATADDQSTFVRPETCPVDFDIAKNCPGLSQRDCKQPKRYFPTFNPERPCCPKYNCICPGEETLPNYSSDKFHVEMERTFGNCTIIENHFYYNIQGDYHTRDYLEHIEEIHGHIFIESGGLTVIEFPNLKVIGSIDEKLYKASIFNGEYFNPFTGASLVVHGTERLTKLSMPKLTEIKKGDVYIWAANNTCSLLTIDFYGELFQEPCHPTQPVPKDANCQSVNINMSCCKYFDCEAQMNSAQVNKFMIESFWPESSAKICGKNKNGYRVNRAMIENAKNSIVSIYDKLSNGRLDQVVRCWAKNVNQVFTRTNCELNHFTENAETGLLQFNGRCARIPSGQTRYCPETCSGGCVALPRFNYMMKNLPDYVFNTVNNASISAFFNDIESGRLKPKSASFFKSLGSLEFGLTCNTCHQTVSQMPMDQKCLSDDSKCTKSFDMYDGIKEVCFDHPQTELDKYGLEVFPKKKPACPDLSYYDEDEKTCVKYCAGSKFEWSRISSSEDTIDCSLSDIQEDTKGTCGNGEPGNGYLASVPNSQEKLRMCYGPGNPKFVEFLNEHEEWCKANKTRIDCCKIHDETEKADKLTLYNIRFLDQCEILDGNFFIEIGSFGSANQTHAISALKHICPYVRKLKYVTGYVRLGSWIDESYGCFERLEEIWGKETNFDDTHLFPRALDLRLWFKNEMMDYNNADIKFLGFPRLRRIRNGWLSVNSYYKPNDDDEHFTENHICQMEQEENGVLVPNHHFHFATFIDEPLGLKQLHWPLYIENGKVFNGHVVDRVTREVLSIARNEKAFREDCFTCHPSCNQAAGCVGPSAYDCVQCKFRVNKILCSGESCSFQKPPLIYIDNATDFGGADFNPERPSCTLEDTCPSRSYFNETDASCWPCSPQCRQSCSGPGNDQCENDDGEENEICANFMLVEGDKKICVGDCALQRRRLEIYPGEFLEVLPFFNIPETKKCGHCDSGCIGGCDSRDDERPAHEKCWSVEKTRGCYRNNATDPIIFIGEECSDGWVTGDGENQVVEVCSEKCKNKYSCEVSAKEPTAEAVKCGNKPANPLKVGLSVGGAVFLVCFVGGGVIYVWNQNRNQPAKLGRQILDMTYQSAPIDSNGACGQRNDLHFAKVPFIDPNDLELGDPLGDGNFGRVTFAHYKKRYVVESRSGSQSGTIKRPVVAYAVAVKELKLDNQLATKKIGDVIRLADQHLANIDKKYRVVPPPYTKQTNLKDLNEADPVHIRYKKLFYEARQAELIEETKKVAPLHHPHLIRLLGIVKMRTVPLNTGGVQLLSAQMVVDYVKGGDLKSWIEGNRHQIDERHLARWMFQISSAMKYLEDNRMVHRDLAVRNILLQKTKPEETHVLISDFGLAKILDDKNDTKRDINQFPFFWYAPESIRSKDPQYTHKSDVWSFGVLVWEILTLCSHSNPYVEEENFISFRSQKDRQRQPYHQVLVKYLDEQNTLSRPNYNGDPTCNNEFWFDHMLSYFKYDPDYRPSFNMIEHSFREEIVPKCKAYFKMPIIQKPSKSRQKTRPSNVSSAPSTDRSTTTTTVDFVSSLNYDPHKNDYQNYATILEARQANDINFERQDSRDDVFESIRRPHIATSTPARDGANSEHSSRMNNNYIGGMYINRQNGFNESQLTETTALLSDPPTPHDMFNQTSPSTISSRYVNGYDESSSPLAQIARPRLFFPSTNQSYIGLASSVGSGGSKNRSIFDPDPSPASPPHRRQRSTELTVPNNAIPVPTPRVPRNQSMLNNSYENLLEGPDEELIDSNYLEERRPQPPPRYINQPNHDFNNSNGSDYLTTT